MWIRELWYRFPSDLVAVQRDDANVNITEIAAANMPTVTGRCIHNQDYRSFEVGSGCVEHTGSEGRGSLYRIAAVQAIVTRPEHPNISLIAKNCAFSAQGR
jgi:hypothetical protein